MFVQIHFLSPSNACSQQVEKGGEGGRHAKVNFRVCGYACVSASVQIQIRPFLPLLVRMMQGNSQAGDLILLEVAPIFLVDQNEI